MNEQPITIEELWAVAGKLAWEKYQVEKQLAEAARQIQELRDILERHHQGQEK